MVTWGVRGQTTTACSGTSKEMIQESALPPESGFFFGESPASGFEG
jgi:hypothetical protein